MDLAFFDENERQDFPSDARRIPRRYNRPLSEGSSSVRPLRPLSGTPEFVIDARRLVQSLGFDTSPILYPPTPLSSEAFELTRASELVVFSERLLIFKPEQQLLLMRMAAGGIDTKLVATARGLLRSEAESLMSALGRFLLVIDCGFTAAVKMNSFSAPYDTSIFNHQVVMLDPGTDPADMSEPPMLHMLTQFVTKSIAWLRADKNNVILVLAASPVHLTCILSCQLVANHSASPFRFDTLSAAAVAGVDSASRDFPVARILEWVFNHVNAQKVVKAGLEGKTLIERPKLSAVTAETFSSFESETEYTGSAAPIQKATDRFEIGPDVLERPGVAMIVLPDRRVIAIAGVARFDPNVSNLPPSFGSGLRANEQFLDKDVSTGALQESRINYSPNHNPSSSSLSQTSSHTLSSTQLQLSISSGLGLSHLSPKWLSVPVVHQIVAFSALVENHFTVGESDSSLRSIVQEILSLRERIASARKRRVNLEPSISPVVRPEDITLSTALFSFVSGPNLSSTNVSTIPTGRSGSVAAPSINSEVWDRPRATLLWGNDVPLASRALSSSFSRVPRNLRLNEGLINEIDEKTASHDELLQTSFAAAVLNNSPRLSWIERKMKPVVLRYISLSRSPLLQLGELSHGESGCCPIVMVFDVQPFGGLRLLHSSMINGRKRYRHGHGPVIIPINVIVRGEFLVRVFDMDKSGEGLKLFSFRHHAALLEPFESKVDIINRSIIRSRLVKWVSVVHVSHRQAGIDLSDPRYDKEFHVSLAVSDLPEAQSSIASSGVLVVPPARLQMREKNMDLRSLDDLDISPDRVFIACHSPSCGNLMAVPKTHLISAGAVSTLKRDIMEARRAQRIEESSEYNSSFLSEYKTAFVPFDHDEITEGEIDAMIMRTRNESNRRIDTEKQMGQRYIIEDQDEDGGVFSAPWVPPQQRLQVATSVDSLLMECVAAYPNTETQTSLNNQETPVQSSLLLKQKRQTPGELVSLDADGSAAGEVISPLYRRAKKDFKPVAIEPLSVVDSTIDLTQTENNDDQTMKKSKKTKKKEKSEVSVESTSDGSKLEPHSRFLSCHKCSTLLYVPAIAAICSGHVAEDIACAQEIPSLQARMRGRNAVSSNCAAHPFDVPTSEIADKGAAFQGMIAARTRLKKVIGSHISQLQGMFPDLRSALIEEEYQNARDQGDNFDDVVVRCMALTERLSNKSGRDYVKERTVSAEAARDMRNSLSLTHASLSKDDSIISDNVNTDDTESSSTSAAIDQAVPDVFVNDNSFFFSESMLSLNVMVKTVVGKGRVSGIWLRAVKSNNESINIWEAECKVIRVIVEFLWGKLYASPKKITIMTKETEEYERVERETLMRRSDRRARRAQRVGKVSKSRKTRAKAASREKRQRELDSCESSTDSEADPRKKEEEENEEDPDLAVARALQMEMLIEALDEDGVGPNDYRRKLSPENALKELLKLRGELYPMLTSADERESLQAAAASRKARKRQLRDATPSYFRFPSLCIVDLTVLRDINPTVTISDALSPPKIPCIYDLQMDRPQRPLIPEALSRSHDVNIRDSFLRARVEGTLFDSVSNKGLKDVDILSSLPIVFFSEIDKASNDSVKDDSLCVICRDDKEVGDRLRKLPCGHLWHARCVDAWLLIDARCPLCSIPVVIQEK
jgi:hypothetical protein